MKAVIAKSYERIHRSNLVGMGVLPLQFKGDTNVASLKLTGDETFDISGIGDDLKPQQDVTLTIRRRDGSTRAGAAVAAHRYADRGRLLPAWRDPALCAQGTGIPIAMHARLNTLRTIRQGNAISSCWQ